MTEKIKTKISAGVNQKTMEKTTAKKEFTIDASGKAVGRVATEVVKILRGKDSASFERNIAPKVTVFVTNASKMGVTAKKAKEKKYYNYSGYPGGMRERTLNQVVSKKGFSEILRIAVKGMLPTNKLQAVMMKNLKITE